MKGGGLLLNRTRQVPAEDTAAFAGIAERFRRAGDLDRAITLCRDGLKKFPTLLSARVTLGWALLDKGCYDEARAELEQVLRRAPDNLAAIRGLAELHDRSEHIAPAADASWHQMSTAEDDPPMIAADDPDLPLTSIFATAASLDEPIRLADFDVSAPADAPVEFETTTRPAAERPLSAADGLPADVRSAVISARAELRFDSPAMKAAHIEQAAATAITPELGEVPLAASADAEPPSLRLDDLVGQSRAAPLVVEAAADDGRDRVLEQEAVVTLPASGDLELEVLADAFSAEPFDPAVPQALELSADTAGPDTLIAELQASGFADLKLEAPTFDEAPIPQPAALELPATTAEVAAERSVRLEEEPFGTARTDARRSASAIDTLQLEEESFSAAEGPNCRVPELSERPQLDGAPSAAAEASAAAGWASAPPLVFEDGPTAAVDLDTTLIGYGRAEGGLDLQAARTDTRADVGPEDEQIETRLEESAVDLPPSPGAMDVLELAPVFEAPETVRSAMPASPVLELLPGAVGSMLVESSAVTPSALSSGRADAPPFVAMSIPLVNDIGRPPDHETQAVLAALTRFSRQAHARRLELDARSVA